MSYKLDRTWYQKSKKELVFLVAQYKYQAEHWQREANVFKTKYEESENEFQVFKHKFEVLEQALINIGEDDDDEELSQDFLSELPYTTSPTSVALEALEGSRDYPVEIDSDTETVIN